MSIRKDSFLENSNLQPNEFLMLAYLWAHGTPSHIQEALCGLSNRTVIDWNNFLREICSQQLLNNPIRLGDESLMARRKYHRGHEVPERWVFGMYDVHQQIGVLKFVDDRTQATLFPLIQQYVIPGTTIHSDRAAMYVNNRAGVNPPPSHIVNIPVVPYGRKTVVAFDNILDQISNFYPVNL
uniref:ISXO2-like transposase domain-containing protein n=1 Tax=Globodera rostochiensis TaxID=31243 RepID=A0A914HUX8_GLORO